MRQPSHQTRSLLIAVVILIATSLFPGRLFGWLGFYITQLVIPVSEPAERLVHALRPPAPAISDDDPERLRLRTELEQARARNYQLEAELADRTRQLQRLQNLQSADPASLYITAYRAAESNLRRGDSFIVNVGSLQGVRLGVIAIYDGYAYVGRVSAVGSRASTITPMTQKTKSVNAGTLTVSIIPADGSSPMGYPCTLDPVGDGTLRGDVGRDKSVKVGDRVVLNDRQWSRLNSGLLVGMVSSVSPKQESPLWNTIIVKPTFDVSQVEEVELRIPRAGDNASVDLSDKSRGSNGPGAVTGGGH